MLQLVPVIAELWKTKRKDLLESSDKIKNVLKDSADRTSEGSLDVSVIDKAYNEFYNSDEINRLFSELILDKLAISQVTSLLQERPLSTSEIAEILGLNPSEASKYLNSSSRQGLVRYDESQKCYALA